MAIPSSIPTVMGTLAIFTTSCLIAIYIILANESTGPASLLTHATTILSAALEGVVLISLLTNVFLHLRRRLDSAYPATLNEQSDACFPRSLKCGLWLVLNMSICAAATAVSAVALASLGRSIHSQPNARMNSNAVPYLAGVAVTLCFAFAAQLLFLIIHFADGAIPTNNNQLLLETGSDAGGTNDIANRCNSSSSNNNRAGTNTHSPCSSVRVKSVPYSQTSSPASSRNEKSAESIPSRSQSTRSTASCFNTSPGLSALQSDETSFFQTSCSHIMRPIGSIAHLISPSPSKDGFDSWDTSDVDPQNRQTVLENSVLPHTKSRFLEAIPVSPLANWSPELKRAQSSRNWTRTYNLQDLSTHSANGTRLRSQSQSHSLPFGEENIHPLFRSSSSTPPPAISAGTVVTAALSASTLMTISDAQSLRALGRLRSGSLPAATSQLNWQGSVDCAVRRGLDTGEWSHTRCGSAKLRENAVEVTTNGDYTEEDEADRRSRTDSNTERKMTPPIPEWILGAGSRTSLSDYMSRKVCV